MGREERWWEGGGAGHHLFSTSIHLHTNSHTGVCVCVVLRCSVSASARPPLSWMSILSRSSSTRDADKKLDMASARLTAPVLLKRQQPRSSSDSLHHAFKPLNSSTSPWPWETDFCSSLHHRICCSKSTYCGLRASEREYVSASERASERVGVERKGW